MKYKYGIHVNSFPFFGTEVSQSGSYIRTQEAREALSSFAQVSHPGTWRISGCHLQSGAGIKLLMQSLLRKLAVKIGWAYDYRKCRSHVIHGVMPQVCVWICADTRLHVHIHEHICTYTYILNT